MSYGAASPSEHCGQFRSNASFGRRARGIDVEGQERTVAPPQTVGPRSDPCADTANSIPCGIRHVYCTRELGFQASLFAGVCLRFRHAHVVLKRRPVHVDRGRYTNTTSATTHCASRQCRPTRPACKQGRVHVLHPHHSHRAPPRGVLHRRRTLTRLRRTMRWTR